MYRQGQYAIVEHTILVGVGIALAIGFLATFQSIGDDIEGGATNTEAQLLSKFMAANSIELVESGAEGKFTLDMPEDITSNEYAIRFTDNGVEVVTTGLSKTATLYGLQEKLNAEGNIISRTPTVSIIYAGNDLSLGGEQ